MTKKYSQRQAPESPYGSKMSYPRKIPLTYDEMPAKVQSPLRAPARSPHLDNSVADPRGSMVSQGQVPMNYDGLPADYAGRPRHSNFYFNYLNRRNAAGDSVSDRPDLNASSMSIASHLQQFDAYEQAAKTGTATYNNYMDTASASLNQREPAKPRSPYRNLRGNSAKSKSSLESDPYVRSDVSIPREQPNRNQGALNNSLNHSEPNIDNGPMSQFARSYNQRFDYNNPNSRTMQEIQPFEAKRYFEKAPGK